MPGSEEGVVTIWHEAVQYLFFKYATGQVISSVIQNLLEIHLLPTEDERAYAIHLTKTLLGARNLHPYMGIISMFVHGLMLTV